MKKIVKLTILLVVAAVTLTILFAIYNPTFLEKTWLWLIGLSGTIAAYIKEIINIVKKLIPKSNNNENK